MKLENIFFLLSSMDLTAHQNMPI